MKRVVSILMAGVLAAILAFAGVTRFLADSSVESESRTAPELSWLKKEFNLTDPEFSRVQNLHRNYMPRCERMCEAIDLKNAEIRQLLARDSTVNPELEQKLRESAELRLECEKTMLRHFVGVANCMPADKGKRYLSWATENTLLAPSKNSQSRSNHHQGR
jgi:hypothetical protein